MDESMTGGAVEQRLREEFNRWAEAGRGEEMEESHLPIVEPTLALMDLQPADRVLDVGCGSGWLARRIAARLPRGVVVGIDVSDEMVGRAARSRGTLSNVTFLRGAADRIPWEDDFFTQIISVESAYYWPDPDKGLGEVFRVAAPGGRAWILINYYRDNSYCHQWGAMLRVPTHLYSAEQWRGLFRAAGFREVEERRIPDASPTPEVYSGRWFRDANEMRRFKEAGALLVCGVKPHSA